MDFWEPVQKGDLFADLRNHSYRGPGMAPVLERERRRAFIRFSRACVGSLMSLLYVLVSASNALIFPTYAVWSMATVAFPLSAGAMTMVSASLSALMAFCSSGERLVGGGLDFAKQPAILVLVSCASDDLVSPNPTENKICA